MVDSRATIGFLLTRASATSGWTWISRSGKLLRTDDPGPRERDMRRAICLKCFACFRTWLDVWILNILRYFLKTEQWQEYSTIRECCNWDLCEDIAIIYWYMYCSCIFLTFITCLSIWDKIILQSLKKACLIILNKRIFLLDKILLKPGFH